jgi:hypothetical protein
MGRPSNHAGVVDENEWRKREERKNMLAWIEDMENTMGRYKTPPPTEIVLYPGMRISVYSPVMRFCFVIILRKVMPTFDMHC